MDPSESLPTLAATHLVVVFVDVLVQLMQRHQVVELSRVVLKHHCGVSRHFYMIYFMDSFPVLTLDNSARAEFIS